jgi:precorrin-8X/cobalt-precorrin-8 methylmutase
VAESDRRLDPGAGIEARSLAIIDAEAGDHEYGPDRWPIVRRMIHATADFELLDLVSFHPDAVAAGTSALRRGFSVITDTRMGEAAIPARRVTALGGRVVCRMGWDRAESLARETGLTRAAAAMEAALAVDGPQIVVVGNAPTALERLLDLADAGRARPALVIGACVGFVGAAEAKERLMAREDIPWIAVTGRKGGTPSAAAAFNALAQMALEAL